MFESFPPRYTVLQIRIDEDTHNYVNRHGRDAAIAAFPDYAAYMGLLFQPEPNWRPELLAHFKVAGFIDADNLEEAFALGNGEGPNVRDRVMRNPWMTSVSVGNVLRDNDAGTYHLVLPMGWAEVEGDPLTVSMLDRQLGAHANRAPAGPALR